MLVAAQREEVTRAGGKPGETGGRVDQPEHLAVVSLALTDLSGVDGRMLQLDYDVIVAQDIGAMRPARNFDECRLYKALPGKMPGTNAFGPGIALDARFMGPVVRVHGSTLGTNDSVARRANTAPARKWQTLLAGDSGVQEHCVRYQGPSSCGRRR